MVSYGREVDANAFLLQDMSQPIPTQELAAKDLHGFQWRFKHIFRGMDSPLLPFSKGHSLHNMELDNSFYNIMGYVHVM